VVGSNYVYVGLQRDGVTAGGNHIDTSAASSAPTEQALRDSAAATQTEFCSMAATVEPADLTGTPAP
jgi:hypothetical protein